MKPSDIHNEIADIPLLDHHAHGLRMGVLSQEGFGDIINESSSSKVGGRKALDKPIGLNIRSICAPVLGLEAGASLDGYFARRAELGTEANRLLMAACGLSASLIDTYDRTSDALTSPAEFEASVGVPAHEILRLETLFETVAHSHGTVEGVVEAFSAHVESLAPQAVGLKTILGYRAGFDVTHKAPQKSELTASLDQWFAGFEAGGGPRVSDSVLCRQILWSGSEIAREHNLPIQFHVAIGDDDVDMPANDPSHLRPYLKEMQEWGVNCALLHCYPYVRTAQWLADIFDNVYYDIGFMLPFGSPEIERLFREAFEIGPFHKQLYSSDAFDVSEIYTISAVKFRHYLARMLSEWINDGYCSTADALSIARRVCHENAENIYNSSRSGS